MPVPDAAAQGVSYTAPSVIEPELGGRIERRYTVTQTVTTVRACSYTQAEVEALLEAHRGRGEDDLGEALRAAILDAGDITDRVVAKAEQLSCTSEVRRPTLTPMNTPPLAHRRR